MYKINTTQKENATTTYAKELTAALEASDAHATDEALIGTCRKCEQDDYTYRYEDCPKNDLHEGHVAPDSVSTGYTHFSGAYVATCNLCDYVCAYWDCPCELEHECVGNDK
jgi:hypothetical protein